MSHQVKRGTPAALDFFGYVYDSEPHENWSTLHASTCMHHMLDVDRLDVPVNQRLWWSPRFCSRNYAEQYIGDCDI